MVNQPIGNHGLVSFGVVRFDLGPLLQIGTSSLGSLLSRYREQNSGRYRGIYH